MNDEVELLDRLAAAAQSPKFWDSLREYHSLLPKNYFIRELSTDEFEELPVPIQEAILEGERDIHQTQIGV